MNGQQRLRLRIARVAALGVLLVLGAAGAVRAEDGPWVRALEATGTVDGAMAGYIREGVVGAADAGAAAVVVRLDTPGGSLTSMVEIKQTLLAAPLPVIVWVAPSGARAASAGTFITLAAHRAYMAPATNIGAASPVSASGEDIPGTMGVKVLEDAVASISALAEARGRPVDWAVSTVADARSYTASQALAAGAIDGIAADIDAVLADADGQVVDVAGRGAVTLELSGASVEEAPMNPLLAFLHLLSDPNIAFLLFVLGALGIAIELVNPNLLTGIGGALALILAFIGFGSLPLNVAGLVLIAFGFVLFVLETQIASHGLLTLAGIVSFVLGGSALYTPPLSPTEPLVAVAPAVLIASAALLGGLMVLIAVTAVRTRRMRGPIEQLGKPLVVGIEGIVQGPLQPIGTVHLGGETWTARTPAEGLLPRGTPVRLIGFDGLTALVEPLDPDSPGAAWPPPGAATTDPSAAAPAADRP
jgi:membrane-bound serine protease (ClpP class)